jgi:GGDEF domain-containing protein
MGDGKWPVTFSIGVASYRVAPTDLDSVLAMADSLMYEVKNANRDGILLRTCDAGSPGGA